MSSIVAYACRRTGPLLSVSAIALMAALSPAQSQQAGRVAEPGWTTVTQNSPATPHEKAVAPVAAEKAAEPDAGGDASAEPVEKVKVNTTRAVTPSATVNLINVLAEQGVITREQADVIIPQVDDEAMVTQEAVKNANSKADEAAKAATAAASAATPKGSKRVSLVPESVKKQMRDEIRSEVMSQAKKENWASPGAYPEWASRIKFYGDLRTRYEAHFYPGEGYTPTQSGEVTPDYIDYNAINTGSPYDLNDKTTNPPLINTNQDRQRFRIRARIGMDADLSEGFTSGFRLATGSDNSPVSTNQTLGGSGGNFSKYSIWLDRAWLKYELKESPFEHYGVYSHTAVKIGRFDNPFWRPTDLVWDNDVGFDGVAFQSTHSLRSNLNVFAVGGAFPIFNTALDFSSTEEVKFSSEDKYLYGGQIGVNWKVRPTIAMTFGASLFDYQNVQGEYSDPCDIKATKNCSTDATRPSFAQRGNSYRHLRDISPPKDATNSDYPQPLYFGLSSEFMPVVLGGRVDFSHFDPVHIVLDGEFVWNAAFHGAWMDAHTINNRGPAVNNVDHYDGGNIGWSGKVTAGNTEFKAFGDWNAFAGYKYLESDATLDAFADSDFGLGGTNLKGYFLGGNYGLAKGVTTTVTWMSASSIAGAPYAVDLLQLDLNAKF
jgi:hypothetical protein